MAIIEVKNLGKKYKKNDFYSLKNANFSIDEGDIVGLVGKNGSGKSTLLKCLVKSQKPTEGTIHDKINTEQSSIVLELNDLVKEEDKSFVQSVVSTYNLYDKEKWSKFFQ